MGKYSIVVMVSIYLAGCSSSPTAPTPNAPFGTIIPGTATTTPTSTTTIPPTSTPTTTAPDDGLTRDARFDLGFYRMFALNGGSQPLRRQAEAPRVYLRTVDDAGTAIDPLTLNATAAAIESVTGKMTGRFGIAGLERGTGTREGQPGWVTVLWSAQPSSTCGIGYVGGDRMVLYPKRAGCRCGGGPAIAPMIIKHEMGHVLGFWHTDQRTDVMYGGSDPNPPCDMDPSSREQYHALVAYSRPAGSLDP